MNNTSEIRATIEAESVEWVIETVRRLMPSDEPMPAAVSESTSLTELERVCTDLAADPNVGKRLKALDCGAKTAAKLRKERLG